MKVSIDPKSITLKRCYRCKWLKPLVNFYNHWYGNYDYSPHCLLCFKLKSNMVYTPVLTNEERFWKHVIKTDTCWLFGDPAKRTYGTFTPLPGTKSISAHRYSWELTNGPIVDDSYVLHKCDVKQCVNPSHLFLGTPYDNAVDMVHKGRKAGQRLTVDKIKEIKARIVKPVKGQNRSNYGELAKEFGMPYAVIATIAVGSRWKHVT